MSWEEAVAIPFGANTALYFLRDLGKIQVGQELLIITLTPGFYMFEPLAQVQPALIVNGVNYTAGKR